MMYTIDVAYTTCTIDYVVNCTEIQQFNITLYVKEASKTVYEAKNIKYCQ